MDSYKGRSPIIVKEATFMNIGLTISGKSHEEVYADMSIINTLDDTILFYKNLLPINNELKEKLFSIFDAEEYNNLGFESSRKDEYLKTAPDDDEGVVIPVLKPENFMKLVPNQKYEYRINLSQYYNFDKFKDKSMFYVVPSFYLPVVNNNYKQVFEQDTVDLKEKPLYYHLGLSGKNNDVDSKRILFEIKR